LAVGAAFLIFGLDRVDEDARGTVIFRVLLVPGLILLWPLVLYRWWALETGHEAKAQNWRARYLPPRKAHGVVWAVLAVLIPVVLVTALLLKEDKQSATAPVQLALPDTSASQGEVTR
ncbi:MAG: hypothetical protein AAF556_03895, partial [Pseudomonadota bacterium]